MSENTASNATASAQAGAVEQDILLDVQHLTKRFAADTNFFGKATSYVQAVDDVSFQIRKGEAFGLVGESGCGKTTVGKMLVNLLKPTSGKIVFDGKELTAMKPAERKQYCKDIQLIFQESLRVAQPAHAHRRHHRRAHHHEQHPAERPGGGSRERAVRARGPGELHAQPLSPRVLGAASASAWASRAP